MAKNNKKILIVIFLLYIVLFFVNQVCFIKENFIGNGFHKDVKRDDSIFISIASYRDKECVTTLSSIYENARHPEKVFVGIVQQNKEGDKECEVENNTYYKPENVRILRVSYDDAKGPCYARYLASGLYQGETYYFQIDSHTKFNKGWDTDLIKMLKRLPRKSVISHYPVPWESKYTMTQVPIMTSVNKYNSIYTFNSEYSHVRKHFGVAGGMMFMSGEVVKLIYFDSDLDYVFHGEEMLYSARLYTYGYDIYSPEKNVVFHYYTRESEPKLWDDSEKNAKISTSKVLERIKNPPTGYFGKIRKLDSYIKLLESKVEQ